MIQGLRQRLEQERGRLNQVRTDIAAAQARLDDLQKLRTRIEQVLIIFQTVAQQTQDQLSWHINDMVTAAIESIFPDDDWQFYLEFVQRRGTTEADLFLGDVHGNRIKPRDAEGGGLVNVVAFALRVALWSLSRTSRPVLILDEPFSFLHSRDAHGRVAELLKAISEKLSLQIIMITGEDESEEMIAQADKIIRVIKKTGISTIHTMVHSAPLPKSDQALRL